MGSRKTLQGVPSVTFLKPPILEWIRKTFYSCKYHPISTLPMPRCSLGCGSFTYTRKLILSSQNQSVMKVPVRLEIVGFHSELTCLWEACNDTWSFLSLLTPCYQAGKPAFRPRYILYIHDIPMLILPLIFVLLRQWMTNSLWHQKLSSVENHNHSTYVPKPIRFVDGEKKSLVLYSGKFGNISGI